MNISQIKSIEDAHRIFSNEIRINSKPYLAAFDSVATYREGMKFYGILVLLTDNDGLESAAYEGRHHKIESDDPRISVRLKIQRVNLPNEPKKFERCDFNEITFLGLNQRERKPKYEQRFCSSGELLSYVFSRLNTTDYLRTDNLEKLRKPNTHQYL
jgi:hypothetical protein